MRIRRSHQADPVPNREVPTGARPATTPTAADATRRVVHHIGGSVGPLLDTAIAIPGSEWTVGETAAHLTYTTIGMAMMAKGIAVPHGNGTPQGFAEANTLSLQGFAERDGAVLAAHLEQAAESALRQLAVAPADLICPTPFGELNPATLVCYLLTHNLMHGCAIAIALDAPTPFQAAYLELLRPFYVHVLARVVDDDTTRGLTACVEFRAGDDFSIGISFDAGKLTVSRFAPRPPDALIESDPYTFFLMATKMITVTEAIAQGAARVSGTKPELGSTVMNLFQVP